VLNNLNNPADNEGEDLPQVGRTMKFRFTARDNAPNGGGVHSDEMIVTVDGTKGPFAITNFNSPATVAAGSAQTITWSVNGTNSISANVRISLSVFGDNSFPYVLATSTPNDGSQGITIPTNVAHTTKARIMVSSTHHPTSEFFDINNADLTITSSCAAQVTYICPDVPITASQGSATLNLGLSKSLGPKLENNSKTLGLTGSVAAYLYPDNTLNGCNFYSNLNGAFIKFKVTRSGTYTFSTSPSNSVFSSLYNSVPFSCGSFLGSSAHRVTGTAISWSGSHSVILSECANYYIALYAFSSISGTMTISGPGLIVEVNSDPGGFSYTYVGVNIASGFISQLSAVSNFTTLAGGDYKVYGVTYANGFNINSIINQTISGAFGLGGCLLFSSNCKRMTIVGSCPNNITLVDPTDNISSGTVKYEAAQTITANNIITGGNVTYDAGTLVLLTQNFLASSTSNSLFIARNDGCGNQ